MDTSGVWDLDMETPVTLDGLVRPVPEFPLPLGISRGVRLSHTKQLDFIHRFMACPLVPSYTADKGLSLDHAYTFHIHNNWSASLMDRLHLSKFLKMMKEEGSDSMRKGFSWFRDVGRKLVDTCSVGFGSEILATPDTSLSIETYMKNEEKVDRSKAVLHHKFLQHDLIIEAARPGLFVDKNGNYWDMPSSVSVDLASNVSDSGLSYHLCLQHNSGCAKNLKSGEDNQVPSSLLPELCAKSAFCFTKNVDIWRKKEGKVKMVQPYDMFLSDPHVSVAGNIGSVFGAFLGDSLTNLSKNDKIRPFKPINLHAQGNNISVLVDLFASFSFTAQHGNFQRLVFDLSRINSRLDFPSVAASLKGAVNMTHDLYTSKKLNMEAISAVCPDVTVSLQQQIAGPFSFRAESKLRFDPTNPGGGFTSLDDSVFAIEYALQVLGSARATAWYSTKNQEAMVELRFFEC